MQSSRWLGGPVHHLLHVLHTIGYILMGEGADTSCYHQPKSSFTVSARHLIYQFRHHTDPNTDSRCLLLSGSQSQESQQVPLSLNTDTLCTFKDCIKGIIFQSQYILDTWICNNTGKVKSLLYCADAAGSFSLGLNTYSCTLTNSGSWFIFIW